MAVRAPANAPQSSWRCLRARDAWAVFTAALFVLLAVTGVRPRVQW